MKRFVALACLTAALAGCAGTQLPVPERTAPVTLAETAEPAADAEALLAYFQQLRKMSVPELAREHQSAQRAFERTRSDYARVRLAMVLTPPNATPADSARALELVAPVVKNRQSRLQGIAFLLDTYLRELRRIDAEAQDMQQKLEQLKSLERTMIEREQPGRRR